MESEATYSSGGVRLELFGGPRVFVDAEELKLSTLQAQLLALVYTSGEHGIERSEATWLLWEEEGPRARHRLSQLLYELNHRSVHPLVTAQGDRLAGAAGVECDYWELRRGVGSRTVSAAFLCRLRASNIEFRHWLEGHTVTATQIAKAHAKCALDEAFSRARYHDAITIAASALQMEPWNEEILRCLIKAYLMTGSATEAMDAYRAYEGLIHRTLSDWEPEEATVSLVASIGQGRPSQVAHQGGERLPLVGRIPELEDLVRAVRDDRSGWKDIVISGEAGIGKSRLLAELQRRLLLDSNAVVCITGTKMGKRVPVNAVADVLETFPTDKLERLDPLWSDVLAALVPGLVLRSGHAVRPPPEVQPQSIPRRACEAVHSALDLALGGARMVILIDDLHWVDQSSLGVFDFLRTRLFPPNVVVVSTIRIERMNDECAATEYLSGIRRDRCHWIGLDPLTSAESHALLSHIVDEAAGSRIQELVDAGGGVPFYIIEMANEVTAGRVGSGRHWKPTSDLRAILEPRLAAICLASKGLLEALSIAGMETPVRQAFDLAGLTYQAGVVEELQSARLVKASEGSVDICHDLIRQFVYTNMPEVRRRTFHSRFARMLSSFTGSVPDGLVALHYELGGVKDLSYRHGVQAAQDAFVNGAFLESASFRILAARCALTKGEECVQRQSAAHLFRLRGRFREAGDELRKCETLAQGSEMLRVHSASRIERLQCDLEAGLISGRECLAQLNWLETKEIVGDAELVVQCHDLQVRAADYACLPDSAATVLRRAEATRPIDAAARVRWHLLRTWNISYGDPQIAIGASEQALAEAQRVQQPELLATALARRMIILHCTAQLDTTQGRELVSTAKMIAQGTGDLHQHIGVLVNFSVWLAECGRAQEARAVLAEADALAGESEVNSPILLLNRAELSLMEADYVGSLECFTAADAAIPLNRKSFRTFVDCGMAYCYLQLGRLTEFRMLEKRLPSPEDLTRRPVIDPWVVAMYQTKRWETLRRGPEAVEWLTVWIDSVRARNVPSWLKLLLLELRLRSRYNIGQISIRAQEGLEVALRCGLKERAGEIRKYIKTTRS